jgi:hypothetical protein
MKYAITTFPHVKVSFVGQEGVHFNELSVKDIYSRFLKYKDKSSDVKDEQKHFILAKYKDSSSPRTSENIDYYSGIVIDFDKYGKNYNYLKEEISNTLKGIDILYYTTSSHSFENPRVRLIIFCNRNFKSDEKTNILINLTQTFSSELERAIDQHNTFGNNALSRLPYNSPEFEMVYCQGLTYDIGGNLTTTSSNSNEKQDLEELTLKKTFNNIPVQDLTTDKIKELLVEYKKIVGFDEETGQFNDYETWVEVGSILHHQFKGSEEGLSLWKEISCEDGHTIEYTYKKFSNDKENPKTFKTIMKAVRESKIPPKIALFDPDAPPLKVDKSKTVDVDTFPHLHYGKTTIKPKDTYDNFVHIMKFYNVDLGVDIITKKVTLFGNGDQNANQEDILDLMEINNMSSKSRGIRYINKYANENRYNSFYNLLNKTKWDGICRLNDFYNTLRVKPEYTELRNSYLLTWLKQFIYISCFSSEYPYKSKNIAKRLLVLQSKQDGGKSTWVKNLLPNEFEKQYISIGATLKTDDDRHTLGLVNKLIVELAELEKSFKHSDINAFKAFYGRTVDTLKMIYVTFPVDFERTTSFIATTNDFYFLKDNTGSNRFMIIPLDDDYKDEKGLSILCNGRHNIDMLMLYRQIYEDKDGWVNFDLNSKDREIQKELNSQFFMNDVMEDLFFEEFGKDIDYKAPLYSCKDILQKLGYTTNQISKKLKNDLATFLRLKNYPYLKREGKFRLISLRKEVQINDSEIQKEAY